MKMKTKILSVTLLALSIGLMGCNPSKQKTQTDDINVQTLSIDYEALTLEIGGSISITATLGIAEGKEYTGGITWTSSDPNVCIVDTEGNVLAVGSGVCYISAIAGYKIASCTIKVPSKDVPIGDQFTLSDTSITIKTGSSRQIYAYFNGSVVNATWSSSNGSVASVSQAGFLTTINEGATTITAKYTKDNVEFKAMCNVLVSNDAPEDFTITLSSSSLSLVKNSTAQLTAYTSQPATVTWSTSDSSICNVDDSGLIRANKVGNAQITASANGKSAFCTITVSEEREEDKKVDIYFFLDYNNVDMEDETGTKLLAHFKWYQDVPLKEADELPANPTTSSDPAFPYFIGWSSHTIIDQKSDLWDINTDVVGASYHLNLYGIWSDTREFNV